MARSTSSPWSPAPSNGSGEKQEIGLALNDTVSLDADTTVRFAEFFPDYAVRDGQVYKKSNYLENPAAHLVVTSKSAGKDFDVWFPPLDEVADNSKAPYQLHATDLKMGHFTDCRFRTNRDSGESGQA